MTTPLPVNDPARKALEEQKAILGALDTALSEQKPETANQKVTRIEREFNAAFTPLMELFDQAQEQMDEARVRELVGQMAALTEERRKLYEREVQDARDFLEAAINESGPDAEVTKDAQLALQFWSDSQARFSEWAEKNREVYDADVVIESMRAWKAQEDASVSAEPAVAPTESVVSGPVAVEPEPAAPAPEPASPPREGEYRVPETTQAELDRILAKQTELRVQGNEAEAAKWDKAVTDYRAYIAKDRSAFEERQKKARKAPARAAKPPQEAALPLKTLEDELASLDRAYAMGNIGVEKYNADKAAYQKAIRERDATEVPAAETPPAPSAKAPELSDAERIEKIKAKTALVEARRERVKELKAKVEDLKKALQVAAVLKAKGFA